VYKNLLETVYVGINLMVATSIILMYLVTIICFFYDKHNSARRIFRKILVFVIVQIVINCHICFTVLSFNVLTTKYAPFYVNDPYFCN